MKIFLKSVYDIIPFKKQLFTFLRLFRLPQSLYRHLHFKGVFKVDIDSKRGFLVNHYGYVVENEIFWGGLKKGWEKESTNLWIKLCENSHTVVDIGANTGIYALIAKAVNPTSKVYAMEPVKRVFKKLKENVTLNNYDIICIEEAASNKDGEAIIFDIPDTEHTYSVTVNKNMYNPDTPTFKQAIKIIKLDTLIEKYNIKQIDLLKIDVETHEPEVLEGYSKNIRLHKPTILIEVLSDEVGIKIESMVSDMGYLYFNIDEDSGITQVDSILKSDYYNFLLCDQEKAVDLGLIKSKTT